MGIGGQIPNFTAAGTILPFSCVKALASNPFKVVVAQDEQDILLGVTDGSSRAFDSTVHSIAGDPVNLQNAKFIQVRAATTIATGQGLRPTTNGAVEPSTARASFIACDNAVAGEVFWVQQVGTVDDPLMVSVRDFGAVGNGVVDDTAAIQAALNSGAKTIFCPDGTYRITSTLYIPGTATGTVSTSFVGNGPNTIISADNVTGAAISNYQGAWAGNKLCQYLKNIRITGVATHGVLWVGGVQGGIENVKLLGLTATNGFIFDGCFANVFRNLATQGATISNACFWFGRDFNANHVDTAYTSNFCTYNFLWSKQNIAATGSVFTGSSYTTIGSCFNNLCIQGGNVGLAIYEVNLCGATINTVYCENVLLPVQFGNYATSELCRSVTLNNLAVVGYAQVGHPGGSSTRCVDFDNAVNVTLTSPDFGPFGDATVPTIIRYRDAFKCSVINYYHTTGAYGSSLTTGQIKRHTSATSDAGIFVQGQETDPGSGARSHFLFMRCNDYGYKHFKMALTTTGTWVATAVVPAVL